MELIKQIKDAENQAKEIVEKARKDALALAERSRLDTDEQFRRAQKKRQETLDAAVANAEIQAQSQVKSLFEQGHNEVEAVKQSVRGKIEMCVAEIVAQL